MNGIRNKLSVAEVKVLTRSKEWLIIFFYTVDTLGVAKKKKKFLDISEMVIVRIVVGTQHWTWQNCVAVLINILRD